MATKITSFVYYWPNSIFAVFFFPKVIQWLSDSKTTHTLRVRPRSLLFTTVSAVLHLQLMFQCSAVRVLTQQLESNFMFADLE